MILKSTATFLSVCPTSLRRPLQTTSYVNLFLFAVGRASVKGSHGNHSFKLRCACLLCVLVFSELEECWIVIVEHAIITSGTWRNTFALLMHIYILWWELLAFLAVDIHIWHWGLDTCKTPNQKVMLMLSGIPSIFLISFGVLAYKFGVFGVRIMFCKWGTWYRGYPTGAEI